MPDSGFPASPPHPRSRAFTRRPTGPQRFLVPTLQDDLFYRLHVIPIVVPPLRDRAEDVPMLAAYFAEKHARRCRKSIDALDDDVMAALQEYHWPGNVRELENAIERAVVLTASTTITREAITLEGTVSSHPSGMPWLRLRQNVEWIEREPFTGRSKHRRSNDRPPG